MSGCLVRCLLGLLTLTIVPPGAAQESPTPPDDPIRIGLTLGGDLMNQGRYQDARDQFGRVIRSAPGNDEAYYRRAICAINLERYPEALDDLNRAILLRSRPGASSVSPTRQEPAPTARDRTLSRYYQFRALVEMALDQPEGRLADLTEAIRSFPGNTEALNDRAVSLLDRERYPEALRDLNSALAINPRQWISYNVRAQVLRRLGRVAEARRDALLFGELNHRFQERRKAYREGVAAHRKAMATGALEDFATALGRLSTAVSIDRDLASPDDVTLAESTYELGTTYVDMLDAGRAIGYLDESRRLYEGVWKKDNTGISQAYAVVAQAASLLRDFARARYFAGKTLALDRLNWGLASRQYAVSAHNYALFRARQGERYRPADAADLACALSRSATAAAYVRKHLDQPEIRAKAPTLISTYCYLLKRCGRQRDADAFLAGLAPRDDALRDSITRGIQQLTEGAALYSLSFDDQSPASPNTMALAAFYVQKAETAASAGDWDAALAAWGLARAYQRASIQSISFAISEESLSRYLGGDSDDSLPHALSLVRVRPDQARFREATAQWLLAEKSIRGEWLAGRYQTINRVRDLNPARLHDIDGPLRELRELRRALTNTSDPKQEQFERESELDFLIARRMAEISVRAPFLTGVQLEDVRRALPDDGILIDIFRVPDRLQPAAGPRAPARDQDVAWVIRPLGRDPAVVVVDLGDPAQYESEFALNAQMGLLWKPTLRQARFQKLWEQAKLDEAQQWWISPQHSWWSIAWEAFRDPIRDEYIVQRKVIRYVTTGRRILAATERAGDLSAPVFVTPARGKGTWIDRSVAGAALTRLTGRTPRSLDVDDLRFADQFLTLNRPAMLIVNTHGLSRAVPVAGALGPQHLDQDADGCSFDPPPSVAPNPWRDCTLRDSENKTSRVSALDILATDLRGTNLVMLLACETAAGPEPLTPAGPDALVTLREAFHIAGASAVIGTLGEIPDGPTAEIGGRLLQELANARQRGEPLDPGLALTRAKRAYLSKHGPDADPYEWAGLTVSQRGVAGRRPDVPVRAGPKDRVPPLTELLETAARQETNGQSPYATLSAAIRAYPDDYRPYLERARSSLRRRVLSGKMILDDLDNAIQRAPDLPEIRVLRAELEFENHYYYAARLDSQEALRLGLKTPKLLKIRWLAQWYEGLFEPALQSGLDYAAVAEQ